MVTCAALFTACKKDKEKTTAEKVLGKWTSINSVENDFYNNTPHVTTYPAAAGDYADFRNDGKVYSKDGVDLDTSSYSITTDNKIIIESETLEIKTLTDNQFVLYNKDIDPITPTEYYEVTLNLSK